MQHLTTRDQVVLSLLDQHRTLTTQQIAAVAFTNSSSTNPSSRRTTSRSTGRAVVGNGTAGAGGAGGVLSAARTRLYRLRRAGWLDCFTPVRGGRGLGTHWVLAQAGARWAAHLNAAHPDERRHLPSARELRDRNEAIAASSQLPHLDGQNGFFVALLATAAAHRARGQQARLARWWSPARTAEGFGGRVHPDGHGVWVQSWPQQADQQARQAGQAEQGGVRQVGFLLEWDTGTETLGKLLKKVETYRRLRADGHGPDYPILFVLPSLARETNLHALLTQEAVPTRTLAPSRTRAGGWADGQSGLTIATTHTAAIDGNDDGPAGPVWRVAGNGRRRHLLIELPSDPGEAGPFHPGPPVPAHDPLALMATEPFDGMDRAEPR